MPVQKFGDPQLGWILISRAPRCIEDCQGRDRKLKTKLAAAIAAKQAALSLSPAKQALAKHESEELHDNTSEES